MVDRRAVEEFCSDFDGIVAIDEAYADFADDNCMEFATKYPNVLVLRTFSKSSSLAGARLDSAVGHPVLIDGLMKLKDSYNVDMLTQVVGCAAFADEATLKAHVTAIRATRTRLAADFGIVSKAKIDVFLEFSCFFGDPANVGNLISGSSAFSKTSLK